MSVFFKSISDVSVADPDPGSGAFLTSGFVLGYKSRSGSGILIRDEHPEHISENLETIVWVKKYLNSLMRMRIRDPESFLTLDPGSGMEKFGSGINIPDPQH